MRRIVLIVFALMVMSPSAAFARSEYLCRFDHQVRASCCCPAKAQQADASQSASVREACCCTVFERAPSRAQQATEDRTGSRVPLPVFVASSFTHEPVREASGASVAPSPRSTAPPDWHRELFVRHCAFLL
ncbi:MAG TPA: hypothetical protein VH165_19295 [Kofleriaceae bacterium]|nr:hypothetical protein [Kofleriaceae bacterium]